MEDSKYIMQERFPLPRFFVCKPGDSNERKIKVKINVSNPGTNTNATDKDIFTEDVSLHLFMQHLTRMAV